MKPFEDWLTIPQACHNAKHAGRSLETQDLALYCRIRFGPNGLAVFINSDGIHSVPPLGHRGGNGIWLIHKDAVAERLLLRSRGRGRPRTKEKPCEPSQG